jgi:hypothetical protein
MTDVVRRGRECRKADKMQERAQRDEDFYTNSTYKCVNDLQKKKRWK